VTNPGVWWLADRPSGPLPVRFHDHQTFLEIGEVGFLEAGPRL
jgi:hypothetical protein